MRKESNSMLSAMSRIKLFLDSSALFAGIASSKGASRALLLMSEINHISIIISEQVVVETERAVARKIPYAINDLRKAILSSKSQIVNNPPIDDVEANKELISDPTDIPIVLAAMKAQADFLVTLDRKHFIDDPTVAQRSGLQIGTPGDALAWIRSQSPPLK